MNQRKQDLEFGCKCENDCLEILKTTFDATLEKTQNKYAVFDYRSDKYLIELKSRRNKHNEYPDTMVGKNKFDFAETSVDKKVVFCFQFTDGLYYWEYDKDKLEDVNFRQGGRWDRGRSEIKDYAYIKTSALIPI